MNCLHCKTLPVKRGCRNQVQIYFCKACKKYYQSAYKIKQVTIKQKNEMVELTVEAMGIRSIARFLKISHTSVIRHLKKSADAIKPVKFIAFNQRYEIDELCTYIGNKKNLCWVSYALNRETGSVEGFIVGRRTKENLTKLLKPILACNPKVIYTDKLNIYPSLIPKEIHKIFARCTNKIERYNLTLRTHLKRLARKTICYSRTIYMLWACMHIYIGIRNKAFIFRSGTLITKRF